MHEEQNCTTAFVQYGPILEIQVSQKSKILTLQPLGGTFIWDFPRARYSIAAFLDIIGTLGRELQIDISPILRHFVNTSYSKVQNPHSATLSGDLYLGISASPMLPCGRSCYPWCMRKKLHKHICRIQRYPVHRVS